MKKFEKAFNNATNNKYPFVRFTRAEYSGSGNTLTLFFLRKGDAVDDGRFNEGVEKEINTVLASFLPDDIMFKVRYTKVCADEETIRAKLVQALQKVLSAAAANISPEDVTVSVSDKAISIEIKAEKAYYALLSPDDVKEKICEFMNNNFVENIRLEISEKYITADEYAEIIEKSKVNLEKSGINSAIEFDENGNIKNDDSAFEGLIDTQTIVLSEDARQIKVGAKRNLLGKAFLGCMPMYIGDLNDSYDSVYVCGKVAGCQRREYNNKYYGQAPSSKNARFKKNVTDEKLPMYSFMLDDSTGKLPAVCFLRDCNDEDIQSNLIDDNEVVVQGKVSLRNGALQIIADKIWLADIDYDSVKNEIPVKREAGQYQNIFPEKYFEESQCDMSDFLNGGDNIAPYLMGKTFVAFDFETTGLDTSKCSIVQIGAFKITDGKITETFNTLVNPMMHIPEESTAIHGITDNDVKSALEIKDIIPDFYKFTRDAVLVGHNVFGYDLPILTRVARAENFVFDNDVLDTYILAKNQLKLGSYSLINLAKHFNIDLTNAHNADFDALATAKLFIILAKNLK